MQHNVAGSTKLTYGLLLSVLMLCGCASRMNPEGGKKDIDPPVLVSAIPENSTLNFNDEKITLTFNEYVQLAELSEQLVISPLMEPAPYITAYKNTITIDLPDTLLPATTYSFNFGKSIVDIHESNALDGFRYVFSTGNRIDSMQISGRVTEAATANPVKEITVMLYRTDNLKDTLLLKRKPDYVVRTDEGGRYSLRNLAAGKYVLLALDDKNGNYKYDDPSEEALGFSSALLTLPQDSIKDVSISNSLADKLRVKRAFRIRKTSVQVLFNRPVDSLEITLPGNREYTSPYYFSERRDTLHLFSTDTLQDSLIVYLSGSHALRDTIAMRMIMGKAVLDASAKGLLLSVSENPAITGPTGSLEITSLNTLVLADSILLYEDSVQVKDVVAVIDKSDARRFSITHKWKAGSLYRMLALPGRVKDVYGYTNDTLDVKFKMPDEGSSGELLVTIAGNPAQNESYILQLCTDDFKVVRAVPVTTLNVQFLYVQPGNYRLRIIHDVNKNGIWDESEYSALKQAEPVSVIASFQVRAAWTLEKEIMLPE